MSEAIRAAARPDDTLVRLGGGELGVLVADCDPRDLKDPARRFHEAVRRRPLVDGGRDLGLTVSVGAAHRPARAPTGLDDLDAAADSALYLAKQRARDCVVVAPPVPSAVPQPMVPSRVS